MRRILGVYFLVTGALYIPMAIVALGYETAGGPRWPLVAAPLCEGLIAFAAGWWLFRSTEPRGDDRGEAIEGPFLAPILQLLGVYFVVEGLAEVVALGANMYFFGEAWQIRLGTVLGAIVRLFAGALLVAKSTAIVERVRALGKTQPDRCCTCGLGVRRWGSRVLSNSDSVAIGTLDQACSESAGVSPLRRP